MINLSWLLLTLVLALLGCGPPFSFTPAPQGDPPLDFAALSAHPDKYQGRAVNLGGEVMSVLTTDRGSVLTVNQLTLDARFRPRDDSPSGGSFLVHSDRWLRADDYLPRRKVTVAGTFMGRQNGLPLIKAQDIYAWEPPDQLVIPPWMYDYDPNLKYWFTPPYFDPWSRTSR